MRTKKTQKALSQALTAPKSLQKGAQGLEHNVILLLWQDIQKTSRQFGSKKVQNVGSIFGVGVVCVDGTLRKGIILNSVSKYHLWHIYVY